MKSILVPTDFSDCAGYASDAAIQLAKRSGAKIHFVHLMDVPVDWLFAGVGMDERYPDVNSRVKQAKRQLDALRERAESQGVQANVHTEFNHTHTALIQYAAQHAVDLIVMGSHGASGLKELFIGSNTQKIVRASEIPVLVVKHPLESLNMKNIVLAYDFEEEAELPFKQIAQLAGIFKAKVHLVFINTPANFMENREISPKMEQYVSVAPQLISSTSIYNSLSFEKGLVNFCREKEGEMIVMLTHAHKGFTRMLSSSFTERIVNHVDIPVMSLNVRPQNR